MCSLLRFRTFAFYNFPRLSLLEDEGMLDSDTLPTALY